MDAQRRENNSTSPQPIRCQGLPSSIFSPTSAPAGRIRSHRVPVSKPPCVKQLLGIPSLTLVTSPPPTLPSWNRSLASSSATTAAPRGLPGGSCFGTKPIREWGPSTNDWDWLGHGIYFWEHAPETGPPLGTGAVSDPASVPAVLGAYIQLGRCFDLLDESITALLGETYELLARAAARGEVPARIEAARGSCANSTAWSSTPASPNSGSLEGSTIRSGGLPRRLAGLSGCRVLPGEPYPDRGTESFLHPRCLSA